MNIAQITTQQTQTQRKTMTMTNETNTTQEIGGVTGGRLLSFMERIERLEEEKSALMEDIKEVYAEAKGVGYDVKIIRKIVALRKMDGDARSEEEALLDLYKAAIGLL